MDQPTLQQEPPLEDYTESVRKGVAISWYRTKLPPGVLKELHVKSDFRGAVQTLGYLGIIAVICGFAWYSSHNWSWWITALLVFLNGVVCAFLINGVHELGHGTVFATKWLNNFFCHVLAFPGWINHETFQVSHIRHHRYTLHPPDDLEVVLPVKLMMWHALKYGFVSPLSVWNPIKSNVRIARRRFEGEWETTLFPDADPLSQMPPVRWSRILLIGHASISVVSIATGQWIIPLLLSLNQCFGGMLFFFCNNTQHVGLKDNVDDFRLCCRTFTLNPVVRFLYWQMNYHIEHHMYAGVPCYNLARLHEIIRHDLPPTPRGLIGAWKEINTILRRQAIDPDYQYEAPLPQKAA